ncbi:hypothetical protein QWI17_08480 [Gilvimarinus sp. SDUM040013]|uniref:Uncharacterized protein n=1 Tax=Gilvimarinus gilvus TaxID=3058038 RepID=A0ABU4S2K2_9GAMM|nr:hypothetical protein [Gilvimarinus sp. SDUM040013]MDO3385871.1 hypothetical protein [Gilvimarinus sp. SDUM040013]MDX6851164.1 hypothetical protein [Gilvimarinus sp. SDUM040013]
MDVFNHNSPAVPVNTVLNLESEPVDLDNRQTKATNLHILALTVVVSAVLHSLLLLLSVSPAKRPIATAQPSQVLNFTLRKPAVPDTNPEAAQVTHNNIKSARPKHIETTDKQQSNTSKPTPTQAPTSQSKADYRAYTLPDVSRTATLPDNSQVFHPGLRNQLRQAGEQSRVSNIYDQAEGYRDVSGAARVEIDGKCFRENLTASDKAKNWYMTSCLTDNSEGAKIINGLNNRLKR